MDNLEFFNSYDTNFKKLVSYANKEINNYNLAEDIVSGAIERTVKAWKNGRVTDFRNYSFRAVKNGIIDYYRSAYHNKMISECNSGIDFENITDTDNKDFSLQDIEIELLKEVALLNDTDRYIITEKYFNGTTLCQIAKDLNINQNTLFAEVREIRAKLKDKLSKAKNQ